MMMKNIVGATRNVKRRVGGRVGGWSVLLGCLFLTAMAGQLRAQDAIPQADISVPETIEMGTDFPFTVSFDNASSDVTGYGPYVDIAYGHTGKDGSWNPAHPLPGAGDANEFDGLTVSPTVTFLGTVLPASSIFDILFDDTANGGLGVPHPFALDATGAPVYVKTTDFTPAGRFQNGDRFLVVQLPFGSFTPEQEPAEIALSGFVSELSDIGETLPISVRGGFMFGNDPLNNPTVDPSLIGSQVDGDPGVEPTLLNLSKTYIGPEDETATGPNFPRRYQIVVSVAPGQVIENLRVIDQLPDTMQFTQVTATTRTSGTGAITPITIPLTTVPGGTIDYNFGTITGTTAEDDIVLEFEFFVPRLDAAGADVLDAMSGDDRMLCNQAYTYGDWIPIDARDPSERVAARATVDGMDVTPDEDCEHQLSAQSIAIQKGVTIVDDEIPEGMSPGDVLEYTLEFQISDYFAFENVSIEDIISDGQRWDASFTPTLTVTEHGSTLSPAVMNLSNYTVAPNFSEPPANTHLENPLLDGTTVLTFNITDELFSRGRNSNLVGGGIHSETDGLEPDGNLQNNPPLPHGGTVGTLVFRTIVQDRYSDDFPSGNPSLDPRDDVSNTAVIMGDLLNPADLVALGTSESDDTGAALTKPGTVVSKAIYAINGSTTLPEPLSVRPGDTVTYRLEMPFGTGDVEEYKLTDFLPLPVLRADDPDADGTPGPAWSRDTTANLTPPSGQWKYGPTDTLSQGTDLNPVFSDPVVTINTADGNNSIIWDYGTYDDTNNVPRKVDLLFTLTVTDAPFADNLFLMNQVRATENNTSMDVAQSLAITPFTLHQPFVDIYKGVLGSDQGGGRTLGGVQFDAPGAATALASGQTLTTEAQALAAGSANLTTAPLPDANDRVRYGVVLFNTGRSDAYDVTFGDTIPTAYKRSYADENAMASGVNLIVQRGDGSVLTRGTDYALFWNAGTFSFEIELIDNYAVDLGSGGLNRGRNNNGDETIDGSNAVIVSYDLTLAVDLPVNATILNTASLTHYAGSEDGPNHIPEGRFDDAEVRTVPPALNKVLTSTEINDAHNSPTEAVIGELATYTLTLTIPEGVTPGATLTDTLDSGLAFVEILSVTPSANVSTANTIGTGTNPSSTTIAGDGRTVTYGFGDITNTDDDNDTDETITIVYRAVVLNVIDNQTNTKLNNTASFNYTGSSGPLSATSSEITVIEPVVTLTKEVSTSASGPWGAVLNDLDAGDTFFYRIRLENPASNSTMAYNLTLDDPLPTSLASTVIHANTGGAGYSATDFTISSGVVQTVVPAGITLAPGQAVDVVLTAVTGDYVEPSQQLINIAEARWTSLDDGLNSADPGTERSVHNPNSVERTGSDGEGGALNDYAVVADTRAIVNILNPVPLKTIVSTSEAHTAGNNLAIGEIVRYRLAWQKPEGVTPDLNLLDNLPAGLIFLNDGTTKIAFVSNGGGLTTDNTAINGLAGLTITGDAPNVTPTALLPASAITPAVFGKGTDPVFNLGTVTNADRDPDAEFIVIEFNALAHNDTSPRNAAGTGLDNTVTVRSGTTVLNISEPVSVQIVEPAVSVDKQVSAGPFEAGDTVTYTVTVTSASGSNRSTAFDVAFNDALPTAYFQAGTYNVVSVNNTGIVAGQAASFGGNILSLSATSMEPGASLTVVYTAQLIDGLEAGQVVANTVAGTWTSLPGNGTPSNPTGSTTVGSSGDTNGERNGSDGSGGTRNNYATDDNANLTSVTPTLDKVFKDGDVESAGATSVSSSTGSNVVIGEQVVFDILVTVAEGVTTDLIVRDALPRGLRLDAFTLLTAAGDADLLTADFAGTVTAPTASPALPADGNQTIAFDFGTVVADVDNNPDNRSFVLRLTATVRNIVENQAGVSWTNTADLQFTDGQSTVRTIPDADPANDPEVTVVEPILVVDKSVAPTLADAGDKITYTLVITNTSDQTAYDLTLNDILPTKLNSPVLTTNPNGDFEIVAIGSDTVLQVKPASTVNIVSGMSLTIVLEGDLDVSVEPNETITNTAEIMWTSTPGPNPDERDGTDGSGGPLNDHADQDNASLKIANLSFSKALLATSENGPIDSTNAFVQIGEVVTYRLTAELPEGIIRDLILEDIVPEGMAFVVGSVVVDTSEFIGTLPTATVTPNTPDLGANGENVTISFAGDTIVAASPGTSDNTLHITLDLIVLDVPTNIGLSPQTELENTATITFANNPNPPVETPPATVTVVEPELAIIKTFDPDNGDAGDPVLVTLVLTNSGTASAYDLVVSDELLGSLYNVDTVANVAMPDGFVFEIVTNSPNVTVFYRSDDVNFSQPTNALAIDDTRSFQFSVELAQSVAPGQLLTNVVFFDATTIDGTNVFDVERDYRVEDEDTLSIDDMVIAKTLLGTSETGLADSTGANVQIGEVASYRLTVTLPESTITNLTVVDVVPAGMRYVANSASVDTTGFGGTLPSSPAVTTAGGSGDAITLTFNGITIVDEDNDPANNSFTIDLDLVVLDVVGNIGTSEQTQTVLPNVATVAYDGNPPASTSLVVNVEVVEPVLAIQKTMSDASNAVVYVELVVTNTGLATAYDIVIEDALPTTWWDTTTITEISTPVGFTYSLSGAPGDATITYASDAGSTPPDNAIEVGEALTFRYSAQLTADAVSPVTNIAVVTEHTSINGDGPENEQREYDPVEDEDVLAIPSVSLDKTLTSPIGRAAGVGEIVTFEILVTNTGDVALDPVEVIDTFDTTYLSFLNAVPAQDSVAGNAITWTNVGPLGVGASTTIVANFTALLSTKPGDTTNDVVMTSFTTNGLPLLPLTNDAPVAISFANYTLNKTLSSPTGRAAQVGETVDFLITVTNTGDVELMTVPFVDTYDTTYLTYVQSSPASDDNIDDGTINWTNIGSLPVGGSATITTRFTAKASTQGQSETNIVVTTPTTPPNEPTVRPSTNDAPYEISFADYSLTKTVTSPTGRAAQVGEDVVFTITVTNTGDVELITVPVEDTYDTTYLTYVSAVPASDDDINDGIINWADIGPLAAGASATITTRFTAASSTLSQSETNVVVTTPTTPPDAPPVSPSTNDAPYKISRADYGLSKTLTSPAGRSAQVGEDVFFTITVTNTGDVELTTVPVEDTYDTTYLTYVSSVPASDDNVNDGSINWTNIGPLAVGASASITTRFTAASSTLSLPETNVVVTTPTTPPTEPPVRPSTNDAPYEISNAAYTLVKTNIDPGPSRAALVGDTITFEITVTNTGDVELLTVPVEDTFDPTLLGFVSAIPSETSSGIGSVNWADVGPIAVGASTNIVAQFTALQSTLALPHTNRVSTAPTTPPDEPTVRPSTNDAPYAAITADYTLEKSIVSPTNRPAIWGEEIEFELKLENTGETDIVFVDFDDVYDSDILTFLDATPAATTTNVGHLAWTNVGPVLSGASTSVVVRFLMATNTFEVPYTNVVMALPTTPPDRPDLPPKTNSVPYSSTAGSFGNTVWVDVDGNALPDEDLSVHGLNGVVVDLYRVVNGTNVFWATTTTGPNPDASGDQGYYLFTELPLGQYVGIVDLSTIPPSLPVNTTALSIPGVIGPDAAFLHADFGFLNMSGTAIELEYFRGVPGDEGVSLTWKTALEVGTAGYRLHRAETSGEPQRIGPEIIVARGAERGADYAYLDAHVLPDTRYRYWLEELETSGESTWYGPVDVRTLSPDTPEQDRLANAVITESGLTRIGFRALVEAGISAHRLETARLQVLIDGEPVTHIITTDDALLGADDGIVFYTQSTDVGKPVLLRLTDETIPEMEWRYVRPQAGPGDVAMLHAPSDAGALQFKVDPETARVVVTGFLESNIWLLDITEAQAPVLFYGYTMLPSSDGLDYSLYFSPKSAIVMDVLAVENDRVIEMKPDDVE